MPVTLGENYFPQNILQTFTTNYKKSCICSTCGASRRLALTSFKVQEKPAVAEVKVGVISILVHQFKQFRIQDLHKDKDVEG